MSGIVIDLSLSSVDTIVHNLMSAMCDTCNMTVQSFVTVAV